MSTPELALLILWLALASFLLCYGLHRLQVLAWMRRPLPGAPLALAEPPMVTVQLPLYNERFVVRRAIEALCALDWPRDRLELQVLDDSDDETTALAQAAVREAQRQGLRVELLHRDHREGFKAGALAAGLALAKGSVIVVFDADFLPAPDFLRRAVPWLGPGVGMVQARWGHLNAEASWLTRLEAVLLDGHFVIEHNARARAGRWFNFNGTAGLWRREAIEDAGGWQHDTLTEDLDLSYRAQLRGWRFVYLPELVVPAELPPDLPAFRAQQRRWAKGSIQVARKLLPSIWRSKVSLGVKLEATAHLCANLAYPSSLVLTTLTPLVLRSPALADWGGPSLDAVFFGLAMGSVALFYGVSQVLAYPGEARRLLRIPAVLGLGLGMAVNQSRAVWEALRGQRSGFVRTPKHGDAGAEGRRTYGFVGGVGWAELLLCAWHVYNGLWSLSAGRLGSAAVSGLFAWGFGVVALGGLRLDRRPAPGLSLEGRTEAA